MAPAFSALVALMSNEHVPLRSAPERTSRSGNYWQSVARKASGIERAVTSTRAPDVATLVYGIGICESLGCAGIPRRLDGTFAPFKQSPPQHYMRVFRGAHGNHVGSVRRRRDRIETRVTLPRPRPSCRPPPVRLRRPSRPLRMPLPPASPATLVVAFDPQEVVITSMPSA